MYAFTHVVRTCELPQRACLVGGVARKSKSRYVVVADSGDSGVSDATKQQCCSLATAGLTVSRASPLPGARMAASQG